MSNRGPSVHAVVWQRPDGQPSRALGDALGRHGIRSEPAGNPFEAFSKLLAARVRGVKGRVLVLVEPDALCEQDVLRRAVQRFDPQARCWSYEEAASPRLAPLPHLPQVAEDSPEVVVRPSGGTDGSALHGSQPQEIPSRSATRPRLKLTGKAGGSPSERPAAAESADGTGPGAEDGVPQTPRSVLTTEELEMLLADDQ